VQAGAAGNQIAHEMHLVPPMARIVCGTVRARIINLNTRADGFGADPRWGVYPRNG